MLLFQHHFIAADDLYGSDILYGSLIIYNGSLFAYNGSFTAHSNQTQDVGSNIFIRSLISIIRDYTKTNLHNDGYTLIYTYTSYNNKT